MTLRFRYANARKDVPIFWRYLEVIHEPSGKPLSQVIEANAEQGWIVRHVKDESGKAVFKGGEFLTERIEAAITIRAGPNYPALAANAHWPRDIARGTVFEEDLPLYSVFPDDV